MDRSLPVLLTKYEPSYHLLFQPGHHLKKDSRKGWTISRAPVTAKTQQEYLQTLVKDLFEENLQCLTHADAFAQRMNERFFRIEIPSSCPAEILFKSRSQTFSFLSNFFPTFIIDQGHLFPSSEHLYQYRVVMALDPSKEGEAFQKISRCKEPLHARNYAHEVKKSLGKDLSDEGKREIMREVTALKYSQNTQLKKALLATGETPLKEDTESCFWGGEGNNMGKILMATRHAFLQESIAEVKER